MKIRVPPLLAACIAGATAFPSSRALADAAAAEALFRQGRQLLSEGNTPAACEKFAASQRLDASPGTLLNLADCHSRQGKTASAWAEFLEAARTARNHGDAVRSEEGARRAKEIEPALSHLTIRPSMRVPGLRVERDDTALDDAALGAEIPVDPGEHLIRASAPGFKAWSQSIRVGNRNDGVVVTIPALETDVAAAVDDRVSTAPRASYRGLGWALGGAGLAAIGVGSYFGVRALGAYHDAERACNGGHSGCPNASIADYETATTQANVANVGIAGGIVALAVGVYFVLSSPARAPATARVTFVPVLDGVARARGGVLVGHF